MRRFVRLNEVQYAPEDDKARRDQLLAEGFTEAVPAEKPEEKKGERQSKKAARDV